MDPIFGKEKASLSFSIPTYLEYFAGFLQGAKSTTDAWQEICKTLIQSRANSVTR
jgi:hypothetical protein